MNGDRTRKALHLTVAPDSKVQLDASKTSDPDGDEVSYRWYPYREAGSFPLTIHFRNLTWQGDDTAALTINAPRVNVPRTIHFILEATDGGAPTLTSYRRVIVTIAPDQRN